MTFDLSLLQEADDVAHLTNPLAIRKKVLEAEGKPFRARAHQLLIGNAVMDAFTGRGPRFVGVSVPQQFGKTECTSIGTPELVMEWHALGLLPGGLCALMSYEDALPMSWSTKIRRDIEAHPDIFVTRTRKDSRAASFWENEQGGGIIAVGTSGSIQGRPITFLGIDDPTKNLEQAMSPAHQDKLWYLWNSILFGRLQPWSVVLVTMARLAPDDFIGRLKSRDYEGDPDDWRFIEIPYIARENDELGRPEGQPLQRPQSDQSVEEAYRESEMVKKTIAPFIFQTMWQQDPRDPEGAIFPQSKWRYWGGDFPKEAQDERTELPHTFEQVVMSWDMAFKDLKSSDWVVGTAWGRIEQDYYLIDLVRGRWSFTETCKRVQNFSRFIRSQYPNATTVLVEDKANGPAVIDQLRSKVGALTEFDPSDYGSKLSRAHAVQPFVLGGNVFIPAPSEKPWVPQYKQELADFRGTGNETDDQVDSTTMAILHMFKFAVEPSEFFDPSEFDLSSIHALGSRNAAPFA